MQNPKPSSLIFFILILFPFIFFCNTPSQYPPGDFHAIIISDIHISNDETKDQRLTELINQINSDRYPGVKFGVVTGDVVSRVYSDYTPENPDTSDSRLRRAVTLLNQLEIPYYLVMGNHDYKIGPDRDSDGYFPESEILQMESIWKRETERAPYYVFEHSGWRFIVLNSFRGRHLNRHFDDEQLDWLQSLLTDDKPTLLFSHFPIKTDHFRIWCKPKDLIKPDNEPRFFNILKENKHQIKGIFVGHGHRWVKDRLYDTIPVFETDSFADSDGLPFRVIGFDTQAEKIHVARSPIKMK